MSNLNSHPLKKYELLIEHHGIEDCHNSFLQDANMLDGRFIDNTKVTFVYSEYDSQGGLLLRTYLFRDKLNIRFQDAFEDATNAISIQIGSLTNIQERKKAMEVLLDNLEYLRTKAKSINLFKQDDIVDMWIVKVVIYLKHKYKSVTVSHHLFDSLIKREEADLMGLFGFKGKSRRRLTDLYELLVRLNMFSEENTSSNDFVNVFSSPLPQELSIVLKFNCTQEIAAYIIEKIKPFFYNLTDTVLIDSQCFLSKQGKKISRNYFHHARSEFIANPLNQEIIVEIDTAISQYEI